MIDNDLLGLGVAAERHPMALTLPLASALPFRLGSSSGFHVGR